MCPTHLDHWGDPTIYIDSFGNRLMDKISYKHRILDLLMRGREEEARQLMEENKL